MNDELFNEKIAVLNHDAGCSLFYSGGCTCDLQARRAKVEAKIEKHDAVVAALARTDERLDEWALWESGDRWNAVEDWLPHMSDIDLRRSETVLVFDGARIRLAFLQFPYEDEEDEAPVWREASSEAWERRLRPQQPLQRFETIKKITHWCVLPPVPAQRWP